MKRMALSRNKTMVDNNPRRLAQSEGRATVSAGPRVTNELPWHVQPVQDAANRLGVDPMAFVLAVLFGANMSFSTPFGYQTNLLTLSAGGYRFSDFLRVGVPLAIIMWIGFSFVLPLLYDI